MAKKNAAKKAPTVEGILSTPEFVDELPVKRFEKTSKYILALVPLLKRKNKWALIATFEKGSTANGIASFLRREPANLPGDGKWDFATRGLEEGKYGLYAMYLG